MSERIQLSAAAGGKTTQPASFSSYLVFLIMKMRDDVFLSTDGVAIKLLTQQAEEPSDRNQELRPCSQTQAAPFKHGAGGKTSFQSCLPGGHLQVNQNLSGQKRVREKIAAVSTVISER